MALAAHIRRCGLLQATVDAVLAESQDATPDDAQNGSGR